MAKVTGPLFSVDGSGQLGDGICFQRCMKGNRVIMLPTHRNANTSAQSIARQSFANATSMWQALGAASKAYYEAQGTAQHMSGYNFYIKKVLLGEIAGPTWHNGSYTGQVAYNHDDVEAGYQTGAWWADSMPGLVYIGEITGTNNKLGGGFRFRTVDIPDGATILTAHIHLTIVSGLVSPNCYARICGNKEVNPAAFSNLADYQSRRGTDAGGGDNTKRTTAEVQWHLPTSPGAETELESPDITTVIQELVDQAGYTSGNPMAVFCDDHDDESALDNYHSMYAWNMTPSKAAKLHITYKYFA